MIMMAKWYSETLGAQSFLIFVLQVRKNSKKNLTQESCPGRGSNPGPLRDKRMLPLAPQRWTYFHIEQNKINDDLNIAIEFYTFRK